MIILRLENDVKALSIRQPWATFIVDGFKDVENRTWRTDYRGKFYIHASSTFDSDFEKIVRQTNRDIHDIFPTEKGAYKKGGIIGTAELVDCVTKSNSYWAVDEQSVKHFILKNQQRLGFIPCKGTTYFFEPERKKAEQESLF